LGPGKIDAAPRAHSLKKNSQKSASELDCTHNHQRPNEIARLRGENHDVSVIINAALQSFFDECGIFVMRFAPSDIFLL
jgi:hypothetical protein